MGGLIAVHEQDRKPALGREEYVWLVDEQWFFILYSPSLIMSRSWTVVLTSTIIVEIIFEVPGSLEFYICTDDPWRFMDMKPASF